MLTKPGTGTRARRRRTLAAQKKRARKIYPHDPKARCANHLQACSCHMCGNPRRHWKEKTLPEIRADISAQQEIAETVG